MVDDSTSLHASDTIPEEVHCEHKVGPKISYGKTESGKNTFVIISSLLCVWDKCETYEGKGVDEANEIMY